MPETVEKVIYISGPMTGLPEYNYPAFKRVAAQLQALGYKTLDPSLTGVREGWNWKDYMIKDLIDLLTNDITTIVTLEGWETSKGAKLEIHLGEQLDMEVISLENFLAKYHPMESVQIA